MTECSVTRKSWSELTTAELYAFVKLRTQVFYVEQRIDEQELDDRDQEPDTEHLWIADAAGVAAYLRVLLDPLPTHLDARRTFGRVAVREDRRGEGLARVLIAEVMERYGHEAMVLHSQQYIVPLYSAFGFEAFGDIYVEAALPHVMMYRPGSPVA